MCRRALRCRQLGEQFFLKALGAEGLAALPTAGVGNDVLRLVVEGDGRSTGLEGEVAADIERRHTVAVAVER